MCAGIALLQLAGAADPYSPNAFSFHFNQLYTHGRDEAAAKRLANFEAAVPGHASLAGLKQALANESAPMLRQRGQTLNGQIARMREGLPVAVPHETRAAAQDAATTAFLQAVALTPADGDVWAGARGMRSHTAPFLSLIHI